MIGPFDSVGGFTSSQGHNLALGTRSVGREVSVPRGGSRFTLSSTPGPVSSQLIPSGCNYEAQVNLLCTCYKRAFVCALEPRYPQPTQS